MDQSRLTKIDIVLAVTGEQLKVFFGSGLDPQGLQKSCDLIAQLLAEQTGFRPHAGTLALKELCEDHGECTARMWVSCELDVSGAPGRDSLTTEARFFISLQLKD